VRVLIVCTGNICRSPMGEAVVRHALAQAQLHQRAVVASAGTWDGTAGEGADPRAVAAAAARGYDLRDFVARPVCAADFAAFDLMLGMTGEHVQHLESMRARGTRTVIKRYLDLTEGLVERDVDDPYLGTEADFEHVLDLLEQGAPGIVGHVRSSRG
jgi:protein-tyrosine phosphatase